jgi:hypothetical protein
VVLCCFNRFIFIIPTIQVFGEERNLEEQTWWRQASSLKLELQKEVLKKEEEEWNNKRKVFLVELKPELEKLAEHNFDSNEDLMTFLLEEMPPRHRPKVEWEHLLADSATVGWKKVMMKLVVAYHPDRLPKDKYHVLCEEVTKELTSRYNNLKGV